MIRLTIFTGSIGPTPGATTARKIEPEFSKSRLMEFIGHASTTPDWTAGIAPAFRSTNKRRWRSALPNYQNKPSTTPVEDPMS